MVAAEDVVPATAAVAAEGTEVSDPTVAPPRPPEDVANEPLPLNENPEGRPKVGA